MEHLVDVIATPAESKGPAAKPDDTPDPVDSGDGDNNEDVHFTQIGIGLKAAIVIGIGLEGGIIWDSKGNWGFYGTFNIGSGVQVGLPAKVPANIVKSIAKPMQGGSISYSKGDIFNAKGESYTAEGAIIVGATYDLDKGGKFKGLNFLSVGGAVWKSYTGVFSPWTKK